MGDIGTGLEILATLLTSGNFVDLVMTIQGFLVVTCEAAAKTPGAIIITVAGLTLIAA